MVVALIALFIAMGGTTYAVTKLPKRSVGSAQLKKGAVRSENIASGAVTSSKLGTDVRLVGRSAEHLRADTSYALRAGYADNAGHADSAAFADRATRADQATTAASATSASSASSASSATTAGSASDADKLDGKDSTYFLPRSTVTDIPRVSLGDNQTRDLLSSGPFKLTARCFIGSAGLDMAEILITTTSTHSAFDGDFINPDLLTSSPESARIFAHLEGPTGQPAFKAEDDGTAIAPNGAELRSVVIYTAVNLFNTSGRCYFGGLVMV
jgi:hypothetical protein